MVRFQRQTIETGKSKRATLYTVQLRQNKIMLNTFYTDHVCIVCMCKIVHNITYLYVIIYCKFSPITYHKFVFFFLSMKIRQNVWKLYKILNTYLSIAEATDLLRKIRKQQILMSGNSCSCRFLVQRICIYLCGKPSEGTQ